ncbi:MAG: pyridoxamine 5'-phosphate oxidase [Litorilinea sp.]|nr:MAG: pyridoxamine 5'-phosphate oxidase [Litorilinea sp.]
MASMTQTQIEAFLQAPRNAIVATNAGDGPPQVSPVWYLYEGGRLYISTSSRTAKVRNLRRDPRVTICVDGCPPDYRYVLIRGRVAIVENGAPLQEEMRWRIIRRYYEDEESARAYHEATRDASQVLLVVEPERIIGEDFN